MFNQTPDIDVLLSSNRSAIEVAIDSMPRDVNRYDFTDYAYNILDQIKMCPVSFVDTETIALHGDILMIEFITNYIERIVESDDRFLYGRY